MCVLIVSPLVVEEHLIVWASRNLSIFSGRLGYLQLPASVSKAAVSICIQIFVWKYVLFCGITGLCGTCAFTNHHQTFPE